LQRAHGVAVIGWQLPVSFDEIAQNFGAYGGLSTAERVEVGVVPTLEPALDVPIGLAVADVIEDGARHFMNKKKIDLSNR
jgi:hypothetical protein